MKKLGLIFAVFLCFSLFLTPNKTYSAVTPAQTAAVQTELSKTTTDVRGLTDADLARWKSYANTSFVTDNLSVYKNAFNEFADDVFRIYKDDKTVSPTKVFSYILLGLPDTASEKMQYTYYTQIYVSMYEITDYEKQRGGQEEITANQVDSRLLNFLGKEQLYYSNKNGTITAEQYNAGVNKLDNASNAAVNKLQDDKKSLIEEEGNSCDMLHLKECASYVAVWFIKTFILNIAGFLVWASANMLNYSIQIGILNFSSWAPDTLYPIWIVVRQIVSLFIVFAGLWLGLMYIIGKDEKFEKYIPWVVIFALFVNFSYPLVRTAIDISNVVSLNIYASAVGSGALSGDAGSTDTAGALIMNRLGLQELILSSTDVNNTSAGSISTKISSPAGALMSVVFVLYAAYIFFMVTFLIVLRTASLVFLIIASPILFVDSVIPKLGDEAMKLRKIFFEQLMVGPVFMIMLALTLKFLQVFSGAVKGAGGANATIVEFFNIAMMLIMLHIMLKVTKSMAGSMGDMVTKAVGKVGGFAGGTALGLATGGAGFLARGTMGRAAGALRDSKWMQSNQGGFIGRHMYNMTDSVAKSSFDARNSSIVKTGAGKLGLSRGMGVGVKTGYEEIAEARQKNLVAHLGRVGTHQKTTYKKDAGGNYETDDNGDLVIDKRKGTLDDSDEAKEVRRKYMDNGGGALFASKQEKLDTRAKMEKANKNAGKRLLTDEEKERQEQEVREAILRGGGSTASPTSTLPTAPVSTPTSTPTPSVVSAPTSIPTPTPAVVSTPTSTPIGYTPPTTVNMSDSAKAMMSNNTAPTTSPKPASTNPTSTSHDMKSAPLEFA